MRKTTGFLPQKDVVNIILTSGASCPDSTVDNVLQKLLSYFPEATPIDDIMRKFEASITPN